MFHKRLFAQFVPGIRQISILADTSQWISQIRNPITTFLCAGKLWSMSKTPGGINHKLFADIFHLSNSSPGCIPYIHASSSDIESKELSRRGLWVWGDPCVYPEKTTESKKVFSSTDPVTLIFYLDDEVFFISTLKIISFFKIHLLFFYLS